MCNHSIGLIGESCIEHILDKIKLHENEVGSLVVNWVKHTIPISMRFYIW